jgi:hypothetical protein
MPCRQRRRRCEVVPRAAGPISHRARAPVRNMLQPMMGIRKLLVLEMNLKSRFKWNRV